jgi:hypothetical protein
MEKPVGELLSQWKAYLTNISSNLMELSQQTEFQIIKVKAKDTANGYTGITKTRALQCVESVDKLWRYYALLCEVVDKASALYSRHSFLNNTESTARQLLENASLVIETERIAINERNILSGENKEKKATPQTLLKYMQTTFESLNKDIIEISHAGETVETRLRNIKTEISTLRNSALRLGIKEVPIFNTDGVTKIESDPLQGMMELDKLVYSIEKYRVSIKSMEQEYNELISTLRNMRGMIFELKELAQKSRDAVIESGKIFGIARNIRPIIGEEVIKSLEEWLQILHTKLSEGQLKAVKIGAVRLEQECSAKLEVERENYYSNSKDYNEWVDLKGHFKALLAKAEALKARDMLPGGFQEELIKNTKSALYSNTVNLDNCRQLVKKFELTLKS